MYFSYLSKSMRAPIFVDSSNHKAEQNLVWIWYCMKVFWVFSATEFGIQHYNLKDTVKWVSFYLVFLLPCFSLQTTTALLYALSSVNPVTTQPVPIWAIHHALFPGHVTMIQCSPFSLGLYWLQNSCLPFCRKEWARLKHFSVTTLL